MADCVWQTGAHIFKARDGDRRHGRARRDCLRKEVKGVRALLTTNSTLKSDMSCSGASATRSTSAASAPSEDETTAKDTAAAATAAAGRHAVVGWVSLFSSPVESVGQLLSPPPSFIICSVLVVIFPPARAVAPSIRVVRRRREWQKILVSPTASLRLPLLQLLALPLLELQLVHVVIVLIATNALPFPPPSLLSSPSSNPKFLGLQREK